MSDRGEGCGLAEFHAQMRMPIRAAQSNAVVSGQGARARATRLNFGIGIMKQVHDVCARRAAEGACKSAQLPRVGLRRGRVLLGIGAREDHAARTTMCTAMQRPDCDGIGDCKQDHTFRAQGLPSQRWRLDAQGC